MSGRRLPKLFWIGLAVALIGIGVLAYAVSRDRQDTLILELEERTYTLERVWTPEAMERGLSGRSELRAGTGMLFAYMNTAERCFWMKNMHFPIDIIWLDSGYRVTHVESKVQPESYPKTYCHPGQFIVELNAGEAARSQVQAGQTLLIHP